jgi:aryl-alcohol dehydrogenase-like predicted oxidoreductase
MDRRTFLKIGLLGATSVFVGRSAVAGPALDNGSAEPFVFPTPVYRVLGATGLKITTVSFGAMLTSEPEVMRVAFDRGVNYVNTARIYMNGKNEEIVGKALKGRRDKVHVATNVLPPSTSKENIVRDVEASLKALETDYIDLIQLQNISDGERLLISETREALVHLKKQGKVRFFGITTHKNQAEVLNLLVEDKDRFFETALVAYNFKSDKELGEAIDRAAKAGIGIIAMKTQAGGYSPEAPGSLSHHQAALKWVLKNPNVAAAIPSMKDLAQLKENISVMGMPFRQADETILRRYDTAVRHNYCGFCGKCEASCPKGVAVSTISRSLMYAEGYGSRELARSTYREIPAYASASACLDCSNCVARCVNGPAVRDRMERARRLLA